MTRELMEIFSEQISELDIPGRSLQQPPEIG